MRVGIIVGVLGVVVIVGLVARSKFFPSVGHATVYCESLPGQNLVDCKVASDGDGPVKACWSVQIGTNKERKCSDLLPVGSTATYRIAMSTEGTSMIVTDVGGTP